MSEQTVKSQVIFKKMNDVMKDIKSVAKDQKNVMQGFKFRGIDQFVNALYPALSKHGVFMAPSLVESTYELKEIETKDGKKAVEKHVHIKMNYTFIAEDGSFVQVGPIPAEGLDRGDKATNKALSAALKYCLIQTFSIPTEDMEEGDLVTPEITAPSVNTTQTPVSNVPAKRSSSFKQPNRPAVKAVEAEVSEENFGS